MLQKKYQVKWLLMLGVIAVLFGSFVYGLAKPAALPTRDMANVSVEPGMTADRIANMLYEQGLINNVLAFRVIAKINGLDNTLKAGEYAFTRDMTIPQIVEKLARGSTARQQITIPEGYTVEQIALLLQEKQLGSPEKFKALARGYLPYPYMDPDPASTYKVEGYIFPDTYQIDKGVTEEALLKTMVAEFDTRFTEKMRERAGELGLSIREVIILASLVEKEARIDSERPVIAGVFLNRLKLDMPLQSCATIQYILGYPKPELTIQDTELDSPYNTYLHRGLPPGPIANPGMAAIQAALYPTASSYLYFVADKQGQHHFSASYEEHLAAIERVQQ